jgi:DNA gyrase inhibitor GyrI
MAGETREKVKLTDREVRIIYLPPMTVASIHCIGGVPESDTAIILDEFIQRSNLAEIKPDFRHFGFDHPQGKLPDGSDHGFERWVSVPDDMDIKEPLKKQEYSGGLYASIMRPLAPIEFFREGWELLSTWVMENKKYDFRAGDPEKKYGVMNEHLNYINLFKKSIDEQSMLLDLLMPIKEKE